MNGKHALITGANTGIGFETARSLARHGCHVILACRNVSEGLKAVEKIREEKMSAGQNCNVLPLDLASLQSVKMFANLIMENYKKLDMLILNAGVFGIPYTLTVDGYEAMFQVNHLAHFYLTLLLEDLLIANTRIVILSSESHRFDDYDANGVISFVSK